tara:strand:- start:2844 stop:3674 length:831 start_codon:yes stop_codon:yes gene_type:complete
MATIDMRDEANFGVNVNDIELVDEHGNEWILVEYEYQCPNSDYLEGTAFDTVETYYVGPKKLYFWIDDDTGEFLTVMRQHEKDEREPNEDDDSDPIPAPEGQTLIEFDCASYPLEADVISDYHNNHVNPEDYTHTPGIKTIPETRVEGYGAFEYEYPIHPDHMYDDYRTHWDLENERVVLVKFTNEDIIGEANSWEVLRAHRAELLANTDAQYGAIESYDPAGYARLSAYRQALRDWPGHFEGVIDPIFADSCLPYDSVIELKHNGSVPTVNAGDE